jgi:enoyl-CoA hydratase/carnithine racemase
VRLRAPFVTLGVVPRGGGEPPAAVRDRLAQRDQLLYGDGWLSAERAVEIGLASRLCASDELMAVAMAKAAQIATLPPEALRHTKRLLLETRDAEVRQARAREDAAFRVRVGSPENIEAVRAFFEKRPPDFTKLAKR